MDVQMRPRRRSFGLIEAAFHQERRQHQYRIQERCCKPSIHAIQNPYPTFKNSGEAHLNVLSRHLSDLV